MEVKRKEKTNKSFSLSALGHAVRKSIVREGSGEKGALGIWINIAVVVIGFLLGGCHLVFGAYPFGLAFVCALPSSVWLALLGVSLGALMLGRAGVIYIMVCVLAVFLRVIISGGEKRRGTPEDLTIFGESVGLRISCAVISGFIAALYEVLLSGVSTETVLFGVAMIALPAAAVLVLSGVFYKEIGIRELIFGGRRIFSLPEDSRKRMRLILFEISALAFIMIISVSLLKYRIFGIDMCYVFVGAITLFAAKRFGSLYGAVVGFVSSVGISGLYSVAFALLGIGSGFLFPFGTVYAMVGGGALLSLWGAYASGVSGFLSVFPEYLISACLMIPALRYLERETAPETHSDTSRRRATDMVGTMALAYRNGKALALEDLETTVSSLVPVVGEFCENEIMSESYIMMSKFLSEAKLAVLQDRELDEDMTDAVEAAFLECGFYDGVARAFGSRRKYVICAGEDKDGLKITSPQLLRGIEEATGFKFAAPEYFRRDDMVVMECESTKKYELHGGYAKASNSGGEVSGDTVSLFESKDLFAYGLISDGMGSGDEARRTSEFVSKFLRAFLDIRLSYTTVMHMLNYIVRRNREECGATVDLFSLDMINGEATFIKSGAAPSYIKRGGSLFRIKSETMPLGFIKQVDAEKITVNVSSGDLIIMMSDGVCQIGEDAPWLIELLNAPAEGDVRKYAEKILEAARMNGKGDDDMTVLVMKLCSI